MTVGRHVEDIQGTGNISRLARLAAADVGNGPVGWGPRTSSFPAGKDI